MNRIGEKGGGLAFEKVPYELKDPSEDEEGQPEAPVKKDDDQRHDDHRDTGGMEDFIDRILVFFPIGL